MSYNFIHAEGAHSPRNIAIRAKRSDAFGLGLRVYLAAVGARTTCPTSLAGFLGVAISHAYYPISEALKMQRSYDIFLLFWWIVHCNL